MTARSISKPGRLTDNKWWFCEIGEHRKCTAEIELTSRFEGCPCECHQTAPTSPDPGAEEWRVVPEPVAPMIAEIHAGNTIIAGLMSTETANRIVTDHAAVLRLADTLRLTQQLLTNQLTCEQSLCESCQTGRQTVLKAIAFALTTTLPTAGEET